MDKRIDLILKKIKLTEKQKLWLQVCYDFFSIGKKTTDVNIRVALYNKIDKKFNPKLIDQKLLDNGNRITLLGVLYLDKTNTILNDANKLINLIRKMILKNSDCEELLTDELANITGFSQIYINRIFDLIREFGYWNGASGSNHIYTKYSINKEKIADLYLSDDKIEDVIIQHYKSLEERSLSDDYFDYYDQIYIVHTPWKEINKLQNKLFELLKISNDSIDFQNIGNTARTIMLNISEEVFDAQKHKPQKAGIDLSKDKFKNRLHTYIDSVLSGTSNREFRQLAEVSIEYVEKSIDLMNKTTHKTDAEKHLAEVCVIGTISAVNIIKLIAEIENKEEV